MDGLCSSGLERHNHAAHSNLQYPQRMDGLCSWRTAKFPTVSRMSLQYPQRMDGLCSSTRCPTCLPLARLLQYPQRMDGLCSLLLAAAWKRAVQLAVSSADGRALQPTSRTRCCKMRRTPCSILSGWTGFAAANDHYAPARCCEPCSILSGWTGFAAEPLCPRASDVCSLAVSSADGRALQQYLL